MKYLVIIGVALGIVAGLMYIGPKQYSNGYEAGKAAIAVALAKSKEENSKLKGKTDAEIDAMSGADLCIVLGGLPDDCRK